MKLAQNTVDFFPQVRNMVRLRPVTNYNLLVCSLPCFVNFIRTFVVFFNVRKVVGLRSVFNYDFFVFRLFLGLLIL